MCMPLCTRKDSGFWVEDGWMFTKLGFLCKSRCLSSMTGLISMQIYMAAAKVHLPKEPHHTPSPLEMRSWNWAYQDLKSEEMWSPQSEWAMALSRIIRSSYIFKNQVWKIIVLQSAPLHWLWGISRFILIIHPFDSLQKEEWKRKTCWF